MRIAMVTAYRSEAAPLLGMLAGVKREKVDGVRIWRGSLGPHEVRLAVCGAGPERAAESLERAAGVFEGCALAVNFGVCGALEVSSELYRVVLMSTVCAVYHSQRRPLTLEQLPLPVAATGALVTHSIPVFDSRVALRLVRRFKAGFVDMEAWEVATFFRVRDVPTAVVKAVSDHADEDSAAGFALRAHAAAGKCAQAVQSALREL